ncbi:MAG: N-acyl-D-amino-acid deacylase family protein [Ilumatobacter sp.]|uniref:N-acyl-D-amino-acid deacylase family protein n=1 Tax=Ilumatobacter sp. TaxID=1967498 RepID=UPI00391D9563
MTASHDLVIRNGNVVDGTGAPARRADIAIAGGIITAVGEVDGTGAREIDADGALVTPGWVDVHTHYDGQVSWDPELAPSSHHGVTTVIMGNCGVGFAPVRPGDEGFLIELMEGVEDIPGTALHEGIDWRWETYGEYLDALEEMPRTIDVGGQLPHAAVRAYVLGDRAHEYDVTPDEIAQMAQITRDALDAGAFGFSTSRTFLHTSKHGHVPGTHSTPDEVIAIAEAVRDSGHGLFQYVSDDLGTGGDEDWLDTLKEMGCPTTYTLAQTPRVPDAFRRALGDAAEVTAANAPLIPQVAVRPTGMLFGLQSSFHPFIAHPSFREHWGDSLAEKVALLRDPAFVERLLAEQPLTKDPFVTYMATAWHQIYRLGDPVDYEPTAESSAAGVAEREGRRAEDVVIEWMLENDGTSFMFSPLGNYHGHDHEAIREMLEHPNTIPGAGDGGAHCGLICDASFPTYMLTHWTRDRSRGPRIPIERAVQLQTAATADAYGMTDRGRLAPGKIADVNVIDHAGLHLHPPRMVHDLPAGGRRLLQDVDGYLYTIKSGEVTFDHGAPTGARPGTVLRSRPT